MVGPKKQGFGHKINILKVEETILFCEWALVHEKLGKLLENKLVQKLKSEKMFITKNGLLNWYSFKSLKMKKKMKKKIIDFWHRTSTFWWTAIHFIYKNKMVSFEDVDLRPETLLFRTKFHSGLKDIYPKYCILW